MGLINMKKILSFLLMIGLLFSNVSAVYAENEGTKLDLNAEAVILMDAVSGAVLYQKNALKQMRKYL